MKNLNTTGTFEDYIRSIHAEIVRLLGGSICPSPTCWVEVEDIDWNWLTPRNPAKRIIISNGTVYISFSVAEVEFDENKNKGWLLENLAEARFLNAIEDLKDLVEGPNRLIERLTTTEPEPKKMTLREVQDRLNTIVAEVNSYVGVPILGEFLSMPGQTLVSKSHIDINDSVCIDYKEAQNDRCRVKRYVVDRASTACENMIERLERFKGILEAL